MRKTCFQGVLLVFLCGACGQVGMKTMNPKLTEQPVDSAASTVSLRLVNRAGPRLVRLQSPEEGQSQFRISTLGGGSPEVPVERVIPRSRVAWDAVANNDGSLRFVMANPESATIWLSMASSSDGASTIVSSDYTRGYFGGPRFVRRATGVVITSVASAGGMVKLVMFPMNAQGAFGAYQELALPVEGTVHSAVLVRSSDRYLLFAKVAAGRALTGILYYSELDEQFHPIQAPRPCLGSHQILDFDADVEGGHVAIFATTEKGYVLAAGKAAPGDLTLREEVAGGLSGPAVLVAQSAVYMAAIENGGTPRARVLRATVSSE